MARPSILCASLAPRAAASLTFPLRAALLAAPSRGRYGSCPGDPRCPPEACGSYDHPEQSCVTAFDPSSYHFKNTTIREATGGAPTMLFVSYSFNSADKAVYALNYSWMPATWPWLDVLSSPAPTDSARFWRDIMTRHAAESNMRAMTLDTLQGIVYSFADNLAVVDRAEQMQAGYAAAAAELGIVFRVDCHNAPLAMGSLDQPAWVASRVTDDATPGTSGSDRDELAGAAVFMAALHVRPMQDVLWSTPVQPGDPYSASLSSPSLRLNIQRDFICAVLSTGPVGIGDMVDGTDASVLALALRADSVVLKPAHPLLRLERFYAGTDTAQLWAAASVPARSASASLDRRANSFARLAPLGAAVERADALWWFSLLATNIAPGTSSVAPRDLFPSPPAGATFLASYALSWPTPAAAACTNGSVASACFTLVDDAHPLAADTGGAPPDSQCVAAPNNTLPFRLFQLAPILPSGWVLLGELRKISPLSPQRFLVRAGAPLPASADSDALGPEELCSDGTDLAFRMIGAPGEVVEVTLVSPATADDDDDVATPSTAASRALAGTVLVLAVQLSADGNATVRCGVDGTCAFPAAAAVSDETSAAVGCSDGSCDGFCDNPSVAACNATWTGALSLRAPRSAANASCGGTVPCVAPADACAAGWRLCLGYTSAGDTAAALTAAVSASECASGAAGAFVGAMSSARRAPCPATPPSCDMGCETSTYGAEPVCCGTRCQVPSCSGGVWPAPGTRIMMGAGVDHRECGDMSGGFVDGVLCCRDSSVAPLFWR